MTKSKWNKESITNVLEAKSYQYISHEKIKNGQILVNCICINNEKHSYIWGSFMQGNYQCIEEKCVGNRTKWNSDNINELLISKGYKYISHYRDKKHNHLRVKSICPNGSEYNLVLEQFQNYVKENGPKGNNRQYP